MEQSVEARDRLLKEALRHRLELVAYARSLLGNFTAAEDAVQEAMLVVMKKIDQFDEGTSILAWCRAIVRLEVLRAKQEQGRQRTLAERLLDDAVAAAFDQFQTASRTETDESWREALERCLEKVPERGRRVLIARLVDELGYQQISECVGMTLEAVRKTLFRLRKQVRTCMESSLRGAS
jgi:RNA polymerase sigma-70 factor, ECF subfamily